MKFSKIIEQADLTPTNLDTSAVDQRLTRMAGRDYAFKGPATTRVTRSDKMSLLKETDPTAVKNAMESAFKIIIAAANGTPVQQLAITKINMIRKQIFDKLDQEIERQSKKSQ
jgi:hypothetical protein